MDNTKEGGNFATNKLYGVFKYYYLYNLNSIDKMQQMVIGEFRNDTTSKKSIIIQGHHRQAVKVKF